MCDRSHLAKRQAEVASKPKKWVVRQEKVEDDIFLVWENENGDRWYEKIVSKGEPVF
jgi:hypothetical protein